MLNKPPKTAEQIAYENERTLIAAEAAGIILGRLMKLAIIIVGIIGLIIAVQQSPAAPTVEPVKVEKPEPVKAKVVKAKKAKKACRCKCPEKKLAEPKKVVDDLPEWHYKEFIETLEKVETNGQLTV